MSSSRLTSTQLLAAYAFDLCIGDPRTLPHPVRYMGRAIRKLEPSLRRCFPQSPWGERSAGAMMTVGLTASSALLAMTATELMHLTGTATGALANVVSAASTIATRDLLDEARAVEHALKHGDLETARQRVARIVGRDTEELDESEIARAVIETLAESLCDGIATPLFALALGGVPGAFFFKAVSTLDSMIGHPEAPYTHFGSFAARTDDVVNFVPARLTGLTICGLAPLVGSSRRTALQIMRRDGKKHKSPNAGFPEAAMAGALNVRLGGPLSYDGIATATEQLNAEARAARCTDIRKAIRLTAAASAALALQATLCRTARNAIIDDTTEFDEFLT